MDFVISNHAKERMLKYGVDERTLKKCLENPDILTKGYDERKVYNLVLNGYIFESYC